MYYLNSAKKSSTQFVVCNVEGKKVSLEPYIKTSIGGRTTVYEDQIGSYVVNHTEKEVLALHSRRYSIRFVDRHVYEKWKIKHKKCPVCIKRKKMRESIKAIPDDLGIDRLYEADGWKNLEDELDPSRRQVIDSLFYMELMDMKNIKLDDPVSVQEAITQLQGALTIATDALKGENNLWVYHRKVLCEFIGKHEDEMATLAKWAEKTAYYHKKAMFLFSKNQRLKRDLVYTQLRLVRATQKYNIEDPAMSYKSCPKPLNCQGFENCCETKKQEPLEPGCVICSYPSCLQCLDVRHRF
jgi:hypothetical protein